MKKVITYGTFDLFHIGHYNILKRAKQYGDYLIVGVTGENYDAERGKLSVQDSLSKRIENVKKTGFADKIIVEEYLGQKISDIIKYDIDTFVIGSDWRGKFDHLNKYCDVVYLDRTKDISSTQIREQSLNIYKFGIVTDNEYDNGATEEPKCVSGIHVESVFCENQNIADTFAKKYELDKGYSNYESFLNGLDIVYIKSSIKRFEYVREALACKKHVICDAPISLKECELKELNMLSEKNGVILLVNVPILYLQSFGQLAWMVRGKLIGDILSIKCSIKKENMDCFMEKSMLDIAFYPLCMITKLLEEEYNRCNYKAIKSDEGNLIYCKFDIEYKDTVAFIEIGSDIPIDEGIVVIGTEGSILVPDQWWNLGYFKLKRRGESKFKRYSYNFDGNGFRYIIQSLLHILKNNSKRSQRITWAEQKSILSILKEID